MSEDYSHLLSPLQIGPAEVRNRVLVSAHVPGFAENNKPGDEYIAYHRTYAKNGVGLQITGGTPVHESGLLSTASDGLWNLDDSIVPGYQNLSAAVHEEGGRILAQLAHSAGTVLINQPGRASWSASAIRSETTGVIAHEMTLNEIREVILAFGEGAERIARGNMDGVEILSAFGFLPQAFLSPLSNFRTDDYGGSLENRLRFLMELIEEISENLGADKVLGVRIPGDEFEPGGLTLDDMKVVAKTIVETGKVDYLNITAHTNLTHMGRAKHWAPTPSAPGTFVPLAAAIREVVDVPVFAVGRITDPRHADKIIRDGQADMVGMTRAHICDPELVKKIKQEETQRIRPCVGANTCIANRYAGKTIRCMHNASVAAPGVVLFKAQKPKRVTVVGGGPAGLECARIAAERGHNVVLYEKDERVGGQLALWSAAPSMRELAKIIRWRVAELQRLNVEVLYSREFSPGAFSSTDADAIILAVGSDDYVDAFPGDKAITMLTPHEILRGHAVSASRALVCNEGRGQAGLAAAEMLVNAGVVVEIVSSDFAVAADIDPTNRNAWYERLGKQGVDFTAGQVVQSATADSVTLQNVFDGRQSTREKIDLIVSWPGCRANNTLSNYQHSGNAEIFSIGDCVSPRNVEVAMSEAAIVAHQL